MICCAPTAFLPKKQRTKRKILQDSVDLLLVLHGPVRCTEATDISSLSSRFPIIANKDSSFNPFCFEP